MSISKKMSEQNMATVKFPYFATDFIQNLRSKSQDSKNLNFKFQHIANTFSSYIVFDTYQSQFHFIKQTISVFGVKSFCQVKEHQQPTSIFTNRVIY